MAEDKARQRLRLVVGTPESPDAGDPPTSFDDCFRRYHRLVATIGFRMLGRPEDVEDYVQDVFLEAYRSFGQLREPAAAKGWLRTIAVRTAINRLRRRRLAAALGLDRPSDPGPFPTHGGQEHAALLGEVYRALETMPAKGRVVWTLRHIEGEKLEDIARMTKMGLSSVKRHLAATNLRMSEILGE